MGCNSPRSDHWARRAKPSYEPSHFSSEICRSTVSASDHALPPACTGGWGRSRNSPKIPWWGEINKKKHFISTHDIEQAQLIFTQINQMEKHIKEPDCKVKCMDFVQHGQNWLWRHKNKTGAFLFMTRIGSPLWGRPTDPFCLELGKQRKTSGLSV